MPSFKRALNRRHGDQVEARQTSTVPVVADNVFPAASGIQQKKKRSLRETSQRSSMGTPSGVREQVRESGRPCLASDKLYRLEVGGLGTNRRDQSAGGWARRSRTPGEGMTAATGERR
jgi:hypothetical protein